MQAAARSFRLDELGIQKAGPGGIQHLRNRFTLIERVFALGDPKPPELEANWRIWLNRLDARGRKLFPYRWAVRLRNDMVEVLHRLQNGESDAALRWQRRMTFEWSLNSLELKVPGSLPSSSKG